MAACSHRSRVLVCLCLCLCPDWQRLHRDTNARRKGALPTSTTTPCDQRTLLLMSPLATVVVSSKGRPPTRIGCPAHAEDDEHE
eukprot:14384181-Alexandrium_andersonii.AAC.1